MPATLPPIPTEYAWPDEHDQPMKSELPVPFAWALVRTWVLISAFFSVLGWVLAATGHFDAPGYGVGLGVGAVLLVLWLRREFRRVSLTRALPIHRHRWKHSLPRIFAITFFFVGLGAALYPPNNYDALTYRVPQILHWLAARHWHWIPVSEMHMNITPPGYGWLMAPTLALFKTDRLLALPNLIAFALLPGLYFSVLRQCSVRARVAWSWMWLLPVASCFAMQAGGIGNDLLSAVYALAALALGFRAAQRGELRDFWLSALAAALATGVKITAAPLALPWLVATLPCWKLIPRRWLGSIVVATIALGISYLPTAVLNSVHTGSWTGDPHNELKIQVKSPIHAVVGNTLMLVTGALEPPICPVARTVNARLGALESTRLNVWLKEQYPRYKLAWGELATEESSGLGLGLTLLASLSFFRMRIRKLPRPVADWGRWIGVASYVALAAYLVKMGSEAAPRLAAPFYPFLLIPLLRASIYDRLTRRRWWRILATLVALSILPAIVLTPSRPLWPAESTLAWLSAKMPGNTLLARSQLVYQVYAHRDDDIAPLKPLLPSDGRAVGYVREINDIEAPLWKPYGSRRIVEVLPPAPDLSALRNSVIIGSRPGFEQQFGLTPAAFAAKVGGHITGEATIYVKAGSAPQEWVVIALGH
ncbi:MAG TPA: hypothetical protein VGM54_21865 [Chthoniobacter sp.]|jgi:hypothetical protein